MTDHTEKRITSVDVGKVRVYRFLGNQTDILLDILGPRDKLFIGLTLTPAQARQLARDLVAVAKGL